MLITKPWALYNEIDDYAAEWTENLIRLGVVAPGIVDRRSIVDICPDELRGFRQVHFFAGIAVWSYAIRRAGVPDDAAVWTGSCPCFTAGTLITTARGVVPIETVVKGDLVWTHESRWKPVVRTGSEFKPVGDLSGQGHFGVTCTADHPFWSLERTIFSTHEKGKAVRRHIISVPTWSPAKDMPGLWWAMAKQYETLDRPLAPSSMDSETVAFICGLYVGDGWVGKGTRADRLILGVNQQKAEDIAKRLPHVKFHKSQQRTTVRLELQMCDSLREAVLSFGETSHGKSVPLWMLASSPDEQRAFLEDWLLTDGTRAVSSGSTGLTTTSRALAVTGRMLLVAMGKSAAIRCVRTPDTTVIEGRQVNQRDYFTLSFSANERQKFDRHGHTWFRAKKFKESALIQRVHNIEVADDNSYVADGIVVHNCQPFSAAGKGTGVADERHLWPAFFHHIEARRPPRIYGEQVASKDGLGWLDLVQSDLEGAGYTVWAVDTCSAGGGAPHIRQRLRFCADDLRLAAGGLQHAPGDGWQQWLAEPSWRGAIGGCEPDELANGDHPGLERRGEHGGRRAFECSARESGVAGIMAHPDGGNSGAERQQRSWEQRQQPEDGGIGELADSTSERWHGVEDSPGSGRRVGIEADRGIGVLADDIDKQRPNGQPGIGFVDEARGRFKSSAETSGFCGDLRPRPTNGFWRDADWLFCRDGKWWPVEPFTQPLVDGSAFRVGSGSTFEGKSRQGMLKGYGNAIDAEATIDFIEATLEPDTIDLVGDDPDDLL